MNSTTNNPWEQLFRQMGEAFARQAKEAYIGTVTSVSASGISLNIDGDNTGTKKYTCNRSERFASGDRVLIIKHSGTYVVACKIGSPGGPASKTNAMTQQVGVDSSGGLWTAPFSLSVATSSTLGGVKPAAKTNAMTQEVGVDSTGGLWLEPYSIPTASTAVLGGVKTSEAYSSTKHKLKVAVNNSGVLYAEEPSTYDLQTASTTVLGGVKTSEAYSSTKHTRKVAVNSSGVLYVDNTMPTASTLDFGVVKTSETYSSTKHTRKIAVNSSGLLYAEAGDVPTASTTVLGGVKTSEAYSSTKHTRKVAVNSSGVLYAEEGEGYSLPNASTSALGGVKTSASYNSSKHTMEVAVNSSGVLYAEKQDEGNVSRLYAGTSTTSYLELDATKVLKPNGNNFALGTSSYPFAEVYFGKYGSGNQYLKAEKGSIIPNTSYSVSGYFDLGSLSYPFNRLYVKELYINGTKFTPS